MTVDISSETMEAMRKWHNIFQVLKENDSQTPNVISTRIIFQKWNKNNDILKEKLRKLIAIKITLKKWGNSWNTKEITKKEMLEHQEWRATDRAKSCINALDFLLLNF